MRMLLHMNKTPPLIFLLLTSVTGSSCSEVILVSLFWDFSITISLLDASKIPMK